MSGKRMGEWLFLLVVVALLVRFWPGLPAGTRQPVVAPVSVRGVRLGMTRAQVTARLGAPQGKGEPSFNVFPVAKYGGDPDFGDPEVTYSKNGRVLAVSGQSLEWAGGKLEPQDRLPTIRQRFPELVELRHAVIEPAYPGQYYLARQRLEIETEFTGFFSPERFERATLSVPYLTLVPARMMADPLVRSTAECREMRDMEWAQLGCFFCLRVCRGPLRGKYAGQCPGCGQWALVGGLSDGAQLRKVHDAWLRP